jgi:RNA polymerase sigma factor (sigma-70 family)
MFLSTDNEPFQNVVEKEDLAFLEECITRLDSRKQFVVRERLRGKTLQQVAEIIGVTRERVRQIQISAEKKIKEYFGTHE